MHMIKNLDNMELRSHCNGERNNFNTYTHRSYKLIILKTMPTNSGNLKTADFTY